MNREATVRRPPAVADWLLRQAADEALAGDLTEEYGAGRPLCWYGREVLVATLRAALTSLRRHKLHALGATISVWTFMTCWGLVAANVWREWHQSDDITMVTRWIGYFAAGVIAGRFFRFPAVVVVLIPLAAGALLRHLDLTLSWIPRPMQPPEWRAVEAASCIILGAAIAACLRARARVAAV